ncbi:MAG: hypothetical protein AAFY15_13780, partial [Cyanobacteria bacterium J06648_11]
MNQSEGTRAGMRSTLQSLGIAALSVGMAACGADVASETTRADDVTVASAAEVVASDEGTGEVNEALAIAPVAVEAIAAEAVAVETVAVNSGGTTRNQVVVNGTPVASFSAT